MQAGKFVSASEIYEFQDGSLYPCYGGNGLRGYTKSYNQDGIFSLIGRQGALCGNVTLADGKFHATEHAVVVYPNENLDSIWVYYLLNYLNLNKYATGMAQPGLSVQNLEKVTTFIPNTIDEQRRIAKFLSIIDKRIETQNKIIEELKLLKSTLCNLLFQKKMRFRDDQNNSYSDWENLKMSDLIIEVNEKSNRSNQFKLLSSTAKGLFNQDEYFNREIASKNNTGYKILRKNQLVFSPQNLWMGNINVNIDFENGIVSPSYKIFSFKPKTTARYCQYYLKQPALLYEYEQASVQGASVVRRNLEMDKFLNIPVTLPSIQEQLRIERFISTIDCKLTIEINQSNLLGVQKHFLLNRLFI
jgi:type I restriction enzyme S subunit